MNNFVIEKQSMKFTVEVNIREKDVALNIVRYIDVDKNECMSSNAELAKYDALQVKNNYLNCHKVLQGVIGQIKSQLPDNMPVRSRIILKRNRSFGHT